MRKTMSTIIKFGAFVAVYAFYVVVSKYDDEFFETAQG